MVQKTSTTLKSLKLFKPKSYLQRIEVFNQYLHCYTKPEGELIFSQFLKEKQTL